MSPTPPTDLFSHFRVELDAGNNPLFRGGDRITGRNNSFVRYFARVTFQTSESHSPIYFTKRHFSVYDVETVAAVDPQFEEPFTYRRTFASGGCCCKRQVYFELILPKRVYYAGEDIEARLLVDNINDERIANNITYNIVERSVKPELSEEDALKYPSKRCQIGEDRRDERREDAESSESRIHLDPPRRPALRRQCRRYVRSIPVHSPLLYFVQPSPPLPKDKSTPQLSPDDQASKLFDHPSVISQSRKEPIFRIHYALQLLIGKFLIEVPFVVRPVESEDVRNVLRGKEEVPVKFVEANTTELLNREVLKDVRKVVDHYPEADEQDKIFVSDPDYRFVPMVPTYTQRPVDEHAYQWPPLGTYGPNHKLIWHPERKSTKEEKADRERQKREAKEIARRQKEEEKAARKQHKAATKEEKRAETELLITTDEPNPNESNPSVNVIEATTAKTPDPSLVALQSTSEDAQPPMEVEEEKPEPPKKSKAELKREEKQRKEEEKHAKAQAKEQEKREKEQAKIEAKRLKEQAKEDAKRQKAEAKEAAKRAKDEKAQEEKERKAQAKAQKEAEKEAPKEEVQETPVVVPTTDLQLTPQFDTDAEIVERTMVVTETVRTIEQHGDGPATVHETITVTEQKTGDAAPHTTTVEFTGTQPTVEAALESSGLAEPHSSPIPEVTITEETEVITTNGVPEEVLVEEPQPNGHHPPSNGTNGHHEEAVEEDESDAQALKKKQQAAGGDAENIVPTEA
ncbi:hypothetical protein M3Y99_01142900 [Aphelenchoides fujianensis]|nr:hypothetical protein M3Y99_01142900 [Aphelenchoides fujianensis]